MSIEALKNEVKKIADENDQIGPFVLVYETRTRTNVAYVGNNGALCFLGKILDMFLEQHLKSSNNQGYTGPVGHD